MARGSGATVGSTTSGRGLGALRRADGRRCPRCGSGDVVRWGGFDVSGGGARRRFACRGCRRTFSDFTRTPLAGTRLPDHWRRHDGCLRDAISVRRSARRLGVAASTAWRWRHRALRHLRVVESCRLRGVVQLFATSLPRSSKGRHGVRERLDAQPRRLGRRLEHVLLARDDSGRVAALPLGPTWPGTSRWNGMLVGALATSTHVRPWLRNAAGGARLAVSPDPGLGLIARLCRFEAIPHVCAAPGAASASLPRSPRVADARLPESQDVRDAGACAARLVRWMRRFRGVASEYLDTYLFWHRTVDALDADPAAGPTNRRCAHWLEGGGSSAGGAVGRGGRLPGRAVPIRRAPTPAPWMRNSRRRA